MKPTRVALVPLEQRSERPLPIPPIEAPAADPPAHVRWLIDHYDAPRQLLWSSRDDGDTTLEAAAAVYRSRPRRETFIEWLWRNYPPRAEVDG